MKTFKELQTKLAEDQYSAEYIIKHYVDPVTGENKTRKVRPHRVTFANSKMGGEPVQQDDMKEGYVSANSAPDIQPQMNEGKMSQIHADIETHLGKHLANYKKMGGSEHLGNKTTETAKHIAKLHGIAQHHAQKLVNDYVDSALKESDESWAAAMEKQKQARINPKDRQTIGKIADLMAKEKAKREFDLKMKKAQNSQRVAKALGEEKKEDLPFTPDKPKKNPAAKAGKYGQGYSTARHLARQAMKKMAKEDVNLTEAHVVHVSDGSKYDEEPHEQDVKHVNDGVKKHGGEFDGHSDKGAFFKFKSHSDAENFRRHVNASPKRTVSADHLDESVNEAVDKEHPIYKEYQGLMKKSIKDLRDHIKQQHRIVDTSEFRTKEHAASHIINTKHGNKRVKAVFGEEAELNEAYRLPSDSEIDKVKAHVKANHPNKSLAQVAVHKQSKKIEYVVKDKDGKMTGHTLGEAVEQIDEISKKTLGSYVKKAAKDRGLAGMEVGALHAKSSLERMKKRLAGIEKATDKLAKEEVEHIAEADIAAIRAQYKKNTSDNRHTENAELLAKHFGSKSDQNKVAKAKAYRDRNNGYSSDAEGRHYSKLAHEVHSKLYHHIKEAIEEEKRGLWANIHAKRERIKRGSGERMRKPGSKGAPTDAALKAAAEQVEESRGHKILATALGNIERWKNVSFDQPKYTEKGIETPKKDAESKEKKQMVSKEENEKVYDEKWKKYVGKSFKKATE